jgi:uncharacterized membrane protein YgdD (TMEM256/DUF423 family)
MPDSRYEVERQGLRTLTAGAVLAGLAVLLGAFGAHALEDRLVDDRLQLWETGARYHMYHALAILAVGLLRRRSAAPELKVSAALFGIGIGVFSGSLYFLALSDLRMFGILTPVGGLAFLGGWIALAAGAWRG